MTFLVEADGLQNPTNWESSFNKQSSGTRQANAPLDQVKAFGKLLEDELQRKLHLAPPLFIGVAAKVARVVNVAVRG